jgi:hypothetical protein
MLARIRLACIYCDTTEGDGLINIPINWQNVMFVQTYEQSLREVAVDEATDSPFQWYTHLGICPACQQEEEEGT